MKYLLPVIAFAILVGISYLIYDIQKLNRLRSLDICVQKVDDVKPLYSLNNQKFKSVFLNGLEWGKKSVINIIIPNTTANNAGITVRRIINSTIDPLQESLINSKTNLNLNLKTLIETVVKARYSPIINLTLNFYTEPQAFNNVIVNFNKNNGCWSYIGTHCIGKNPAMNFAWIDVHTILHEFGHMLGLIHEHQNPSNSTLSYDLTELYNWGRTTENWDQTKTYDNIAKPYLINQVNGSTFDNKSIMLYTLPKNVAWYTINNTKNYIDQPNYRLSPDDLIYLFNKYPIDNQTIAYAQQKYFEFYGIRITNTPIPPISKPTIPPATELRQVLTRQESNIVFNPFNYSKLFQYIFNFRNFYCNTNPCTNPAITNPVNSRSFFICLRGIAIRANSSFKCSKESIKIELLQNISNTIKKIYEITTEINCDTETRIYFIDASKVQTEIKILTSRLYLNSLEYADSLFVNIIPTKGLNSVLNINSVQIIYRNICNTNNICTNCVGINPY